MRITMHGIELDVEFDYQPYERQTRDDPGCEESADITEVTLVGSDVDISSLMDEVILQEIGINILEKLAEERRNSFWEGP